MPGDERPTKKQKVGDHRGGASTGGGGWNNKGKRKDPARAKYRAQASTASISASGLQSGDVGIFVTSDKGREKVALRELEALVEEIMGEMDENAAGMDEGGEDDGKAEESKEGIGMRSREEGRDRGQVDAAEGQARDEGDIEKDILAELEEMRGHSRGGVEGGSNQAEHQNRGLEGSQSTSTRPGTKLRLVTLDIPCVSFISIPVSSSASKTMDPVDIVYKICREAHSDPLRPRSRFIKRLTPLTRVRKVMNDGVERLCEEVLPPLFGLEQERQWKYAVRVTVRNNNQVSKDDIIKRVAGFVTLLGRGESIGGGEGKEVARELVNGGNTSSEEATSSREKEASSKSPSNPKVLNPPSTKVLEHKVDLKNFEKLILVEIYRNVVGMSIVGDAKEFENELKRFNLAEIYAEGRNKAEQEKGLGD